MDTAARENKSMIFSCDLVGGIVAIGNGSPNLCPGQTALAIVSPVIDSPISKENIKREYKKWTVSI